MKTQIATEFKVMEKSKQRKSRNKVCRCLTVPHALPQEWPCSSASLWPWKAACVEGKATKPGASPGWTLCGRSRWWRRWSACCRWPPSARLWHVGPHMLHGLQFWSLLLDLHHRFILKNWSVACKLEPDPADKPLFGPTVLHLTLRAGPDCHEWTPWKISIQCLLSCCSRENWPNHLS